MIKVYRPIKGNFRTQGFGENRAMAKLDENGKALRPFIIKAKPKSGLPKGWIEFYKALGLEGHNGEDWFAYHGMPLYFPVECAEAGGWYSKNASDLDGGLGVDVISKERVTINGEQTYIKFRFWHLQEGYELSDIKPGDLIGKCDNTGASSGSHLHWSMKYCTKTGIGTNKRNGYSGAINFHPYFENVFILDVLKIKDQAMTVIERARQVIALTLKYLSTRQK